METSNYENVLLPQAQHSKLKHDTSQCGTRTYENKNGDSSSGKPKEKLPVKYVRDEITQMQWHPSKLERLLRSSHLPFPDDKQFTK
mmetsp:Transcript_7438/g.9429  ORF Transcript_7438/g.9429 Transcript_7438/m.9429 type:complete len:86 (+) Transcript_7438:269-526(+)